MSTRGTPKRVAVCTLATSETVVIACDSAPSAPPPHKFMAFVVTTAGELARLNETVFTSMDAALEFCGPFVTQHFFHSLFGLLLLNKPYLLLANAVEQSILLPHGKSIFRVISTQWVEVQTTSLMPPKLSKKEKKRLENLLSYNFSTGYYYSDEANLCSSFPHINPPPPSRGGFDLFEVDWGVFLRAPFKELGHSSVCSTLNRGFASGKQILTDDGTLLHVHLLGRQIRTNPGPRYYGRGLNDDYGVGNDHIYELVMWRYLDTASPEVEYAVYTFLRGTVPVRFASVLTKGIGEATMQFPDNCLEGAVEYFTMVRKNLDIISMGAAAVVPSRPPSASPSPSRSPSPANSEGKPSATTTPRAATEQPKIHLRCVNLLRHVSTSGEDLLSAHFASAVDKASKYWACGALELVHLDWLHHTKEEGLDMSVDALWHHTLPFFPSEKHMFTVGAIHPDTERGTLGNSVLQQQTQTHFLRVNCADSLDRTNLGCFFTVLQVAPAMVKTLGVTISSGSDSVRAPASPYPDTPGATPTSGLQVGPTSVEDLLAGPLGSSFVECPTTEGFGPAYQFNSMEDIRQHYPKPLIAAIGDLFISNGDVVAQLYTSSGALHTNAIRSLVPGRAPATMNALISAQRRFENVFEDKKKKRTIDTLLGNELNICYPSLQGVFSVCPLPYVQWNRAVIMVDVPYTGQTASNVVKWVSSSVSVWGAKIPPFKHEDIRAYAGSVLVSALSYGRPQHTPTASPAMSPTPPAEPIDDGEEDEKEDEKGPETYIAVVIFPDPTVAQAFLQQRFFLVDGVEVALWAYEYRVATVSSSEKMRMNANSTVSAAAKGGAKLLSSFKSKTAKMVESVKKKM